MSDASLKEKVKAIAEASERACVLEVSAEKPGNVTPTKQFKDTSYNDFLAGSAAIKPSVACAAVAGWRAGAGNIAFDKLGIGSLIEKAVADVSAAHGGGNTHLGVALLFIPLSAAAGVCLAERRSFPALQESLHRVSAATTAADAVHLYSAVNLANAGGLPDADLDVRRPESKERIMREGITLLDVLRMSSGRDLLAREVCEDMPVLFDVAYPMLANMTGRLPDASSAVVQTYLAVLSRYPDTLIAKKAGAGEAERVSRRAAEVLDAGGVLTDEGKEAVRVFDRELRVDGNTYNPGATADLIAAAIYVSLLKDVLG